MIDRFSGEFRFLSNYSPNPANYDEVAYPTAEHAFAAAKTLSDAERYQIWLAPTPGMAKSLGRKVPLRPQWDGFRHVAMAQILASKFSRPEVRGLLLATGDSILIEGNRWHDTYWGVCHCPKCGGRGENHLGVHLMALREALAHEV